MHFITYFDHKNSVQDSYRIPNAVIEYIIISKHYTIRTWFSFIHQ